MSEQGFLFAPSDLPAAKPDTHKNRFQKLAPDAPITDAQRIELYRLREHSKRLTNRLLELERLYDEAWCVFHRRLDSLPEDNQGARVFATRFLVSVVRDIHNPSTPADERELSIRWLRGENIGSIVQAAEICSIAGVEPSKLRSDLAIKDFKAK